MSTRTPVSILQELAAVKHLPPPKYTEVGFGTDFICHVTINELTAKGSGSSKKAAKQDCARKALQLLQNKSPTEDTIIQHSPLSVSSKSTNYIGELNEYASKNTLSYPVYINAVGDGDFVINCIFREEKTEGKGSTKMDAKQNAAKMMLEIIKTRPKNSHAEVSTQTDTVTTVDINKEKITNFFKTFNAGGMDKDNNYVDTNDITEIDTKSVEDLQAMLNAYGRVYTISNFSIPDQMYVVYLVLKDTDMTLMEVAKTKKDALVEILKRMQAFQKLGSSFAFQE